MALFGSSFTQTALDDYTQQKKQLTIINQLYFWFLKYTQNITITSHSQWTRPTRTRPRIMIKPSRTRI